MLYFVKRHNVLVGGAPKVEGVILDAHNRVEMLQDVLQMEDACWLAADGKSWIVLDTEMRIGAAAVLLAGDGTVDSPWETKERVGGLFVDAYKYVVGAVSWLWTKPAPEPPQDAKLFA